MFFFQEMLGVKPCISCLGCFRYRRSVTGQDWKCLWSQRQAEAFHGHLQLLRQHLGVCAVPNRSKLIKADQSWSNSQKMIRKYRVVHIFWGCLLIASGTTSWKISWDGLPTGQGTGSSSLWQPAAFFGAFSCVGNIPGCGRCSGRSVNFTSCLLLNFHSFHLGSPTIHDRCSSLVGYLFCGSPEQRSNETRRPNQDENFILVARPKKNFLYPSFRQKKQHGSDQKKIVQFWERQWFHHGF